MSEEKAIGKEEGGDIKTPNVYFEKYARELGLHLLHGVKVEGEWWALRQMQLVNGKWTQAGCNWYSRQEIRRLLEEKSELIDHGKATIQEELGYKLLIATDEAGLQYLV